LGKKGISHINSRTPTSLITFLLIRFQGPATSGDFGRIFTMTLLMQLEQGNVYAGLSELLVG